MRIRKALLESKRGIGFYIGLPLALVLSASMGAGAYDTAWIRSGQPIVAATLKANLDEIQSRLTAGIFVGSTAALGGNFNAGGAVGYLVAKSLCAQTVGDPAAHMCTVEEVVRSIQLGKLTAPSGPLWVGGGAGTSVNATADCNGFTSSSATLTGMTIQASAVPNYPVLLPQACGAVCGIACCK